MQQLILTFLFLTIAVFSPPGACWPDTQEEGKAYTNPHNYSVKENCSYCHTAEPPMLVFDPVTTCAKCHPGNLGNHPVARHPIGKMPRIKIPVQFPLTDDREMVCYTCHDPHNKTKHPRMLRVDFNKICALCHAGY